jgi:hypothetical protein
MLIQVQRMLVSCRPLVGHFAGGYDMLTTILQSRVLCVATMRALAKRERQVVGVRQASASLSFSMPPRLDRDPNAEAAWAAMRTGRSVGTAGGSCPSYAQLAPRTSHWFERKGKRHAVAGCHASATVHPLRQRQRVS